MSEQVASGAARTRRSRSPHAEKFQFALALLVVVAIGAIAMAGVAAQAPRAAGHPWSPFKPVSGGKAGALEIANYISPGYRLAPTSGSPSVQLSVVSVSPLTGSTLIIKGDASDAEADVLGGNTLVYTFCGLGPDCTIPGTPSTDRMLLVRTEALEIALYAMHYLHVVDNVVVLLPPAFNPPTTAAKGKKKASLSATPPAALTEGKPNPAVALLVTRAQVANVLKQPLTDIYPARLPADGGVLTPELLTQVDLATAKNLFAQEPETASDGSQLLVLTQLPAQ